MAIRVASACHLVSKASVDVASASMAPANATGQYLFMEPSRVVIAIPACSGTREKHSTGVIHRPRLAGGMMPSVAHAQRPLVARQGCPGFGAGSAHRCTGDAAGDTLRGR